jgi:hypothetical protein
LLTFAFALEDFKSLLQIFSLIQTSSNSKNLDLAMAKVEKVNIAATYQKVFGIGQE